LLRSCPTRHNLASIDLKEGNYAAAREKFGKSMAITQAIGDRAGEAAAWNQLGGMAWKTGRREMAVRLCAICFWIDNAIGHGHAEQALKTVLYFCGQLNYTEQQTKAAIEEAVAAYESDSGASLIKGALEDDADQSA